MKIPFKLMPGSWGLKGKTKERARIEYELEGINRDIALAKLDYEGVDLNLKLEEINLKYNQITKYQFDKIRANLLYSDVDLEVELLKVEHAHGNLTEYDLEVKTAELLFSDVELELKLADINKSFNRISETEYEKIVATLNKEPWVRVKESNFNPQKGLSGFEIELDYNQYFIDFLKENDFVGKTDEQIVNEWFNELCKQVAYEDMVVDSDIPNLLDNSPRKPDTEVVDSNKIKYS